MNSNQNNNLFSIVGRALRLLLAFIIMSPTSVFANPYGGNVIAGLANIGNTGAVVTVNQLTDRAVINWNGFSIDTGELTKFIQPNALSAVLNRVTGGDPSAIYGTIQANGQVFLINPNGIMVGAGGVINTQSFLASTLDVVVGQFMAGGDLLFSGNSLAGVKNAGKINALGGDIMLIAHNVANTGEINAVNGTAAMAAGSEVLLKSAGAERVFVQAGNGEAAVGVDQKGQIQAAAAELKAAGGNIYGLAINNEGVVRAEGVENQGGRVFLTATGGSVVNAGEISAKQGDKGGEVRIAADTITLKDKSIIDISGQNGGGTALVGGDIHGTNPDMPNAKNTTVEAGAVIKADAVESGNGGKVIVWADDTTNFQGNISATGGAALGDGGFAEVSGKGTLIFNGLADLRAPNGVAGTLLLDPYNYAIESVEAAAIVGALSTANVSITTADSTGGGVVGVGGVEGTGTITVDSAIVWSSGHSLTLTAATSITVNANIISSYGGVTGHEGNISLTAPNIYLNDSDAINGAFITTAMGNQTYTGAVTLETNGVIQMPTAGGDISFSSTINGTGVLFLGLGTGDVSFGGVVGGAVPIKSLEITGSGVTTLNGNVTTTGKQEYGSAAGHAVVLNNDIALIAGGNIEFTGTVNSSGNSSSSTRYALTTNATGDTTFGGNVGDATYGKLKSLSVTVDTGYKINLNGTTVNTVAATTGNQTYTGAVVVGNDASLTAGGNIEFTGTVNSSAVSAGTPDNHTLTTNATGGDTIFGGSVGDGTDGALGSLSVTVGTGKTIHLGGDSSDHGVTTPITTTGDQTYSGDVGIYNHVNLTSSLGNITFNDAIDGDYNFIANSYGDTTFNGAVGGDELGSLTVNIYGNGTINLNGGNIGTYNNQNYDGPVVIGEQDADLDTSAGIIYFYNTVDSAADPVTGVSKGYSLEIDADEDVIFDEAVGGIHALGDLDITAGNNITLDGGAITTLDDQEYNGAVVLGDDATLTSGAGNITFQSTVDAYDNWTNLTTYSALDTTFNEAVGPSDEYFDNLTVNITGSGTINLNGGHIYTDYNQTYDGAVVVGYDAELRAGGDITFSKTVNDSVIGTHDLIVDSENEVTFTGAVGGIKALASLTVGSIPNTIHIDGGSVKTTGEQTYYNSVELGNNTTLTTTDSDITFGSTVSGAYTLTIRSNGGDVSFNDAVGYDYDGVNTLTALAALTIYGTGITYFDDVDGGYAGVTTTGAQSYSGPVILKDNTTIESTSISIVNSITFKNTIDSAGGTAGLATYSSNYTSFEGAVGAGVGTNLAYLDANITGGGGIYVKGGSVITSGDQDYDGPVAIYTKDAALTSSDGEIYFGGTLDAYNGKGLTTTSSEDTTFAGAVGTAGKLNYLIADFTGEGSVNIDGGYVTTIGEQDYNGPVVIGSRDASLRSMTDSITFDGTVDSAADANYSLTTQSATDTLFMWAVGLVQPLKYLEVNIDGFTSSSEDDSVGFIYLNGLDVHTSYDDATLKNGDQIYNGNVLVYAQELNLGASGDITFNGKLDSYNHAIVDITSTGNTTFNDEVGNSGPAGYKGELGGLTVDAEGTINLNGGIINTVAYTAGFGSDTLGQQEYNGDVVLGVDTTLNAEGRVDFDEKVDAKTNGGQTLTINSDTDVDFDDSLGSVAPLKSLEVNAGAEYAIYFDGDNTSTGDTLIKTTGDQTYNGYVEISGTDDLGNNFNLTSSAGNIIFNDTMDSDGGYGLTVNTYGNTTFTHAVGVTDEELGYLTVNITGDSGKINLNGGFINTAGSSDNSGHQTYNGAVVLGADATLDANGQTIQFKDTIDGNKDLTLNAGLVLLEGAVGSGDPLDSLTINALAGISGGSVETVNAQHYDNNVRLMVQNLSLISSAGSITFDGLINSNPSGFTLTTDSHLDTTFNGAVGGFYGCSLGGLDVTTGGKINLNGLTIDTLGDSTGKTGNQLYHGDVVLGADTVLTAGDGVETPGAELGAITFDEEVDGAFTLTTNSDGDTTFEKAVGGGTELAALTANITALDTGKINLNGSTIDTLGNTTDSGNQLYHGDVVLGKNTELTAVDGVGTADAALGAITFDEEVDGAFTLTTNSDGDTTFNKAVGRGIELAALTANITDVDTGNINLNGLPLFDVDENVTDYSVTTTDDQIYSGNVILGDDIALTAGGDITFDYAVDSLMEIAGDSKGESARHNLIIHSDGNTTFSDDVGSDFELGELEVTAGSAQELGEPEGTQGPIRLNGGYIYTSDDQTYNGNVTIGYNNAYLDSYSINDNTTSGGSITFNGTVDSYGGPYNLDIEAVANVTFNDIVGGASELGNLNVYVAGLDSDLNEGTRRAGTGYINLNGGAVSTTGYQYYDANVVLGNNTTLTAGGDINFYGAVDSAVDLLTNESNNHYLVTDSVGDTTFGGAVGVTGELGYLDVTADTINLNGGAINTVATTGEATGYQNYTGAVVLGADAALTAGGSITFTSTVDSTVYSNGSSGEPRYVYGLTANSGGDTTFNDAVGVTDELGYLTVTANTINLDGGAINTVYASNGSGYSSGDQTYNNAVVVDGQTASLTSSNGGKIVFKNTVASSDGSSLSVTGYDGVEFGGNVTLVSLDSLTGILINASSLHVRATSGDILIKGDHMVTTGDQRYTAYNDILVSGAAGAGDVEFKATDGYLYFYGFADFSNSGNVNLDASGDIDLLGADFANSGDVMVYSSGGDISMGIIGKGEDSVIFEEGSRLTGIVTDAGDITLYNLENYGDNLTVNSGAGMITLNNVLTSGAISDNDITASLSLTGTGGLTLMDYIVSTGDQNYAGDITLGDDVTLLTDGEVPTRQSGSDLVNTITLGGKVDSSLTDITIGEGVSGGSEEHGLTTYSSIVTFNDTVGESFELGALAVTADTINLNGGTIDTTGSQDYTGAVVLGKDTTLVSSDYDGFIGFTSTIDGAFGLTATADEIEFAGSANLASLTVTAVSPKTIYLGVDEDISIITTGDQTYNGAVELGADITLTAGGDIMFDGTVDSSIPPQQCTPYCGISDGHSLTTSSGGDTTFEDAVGYDYGDDSGQLGSLDVTAGGNINLNGGEIYTVVTTAGGATTTGDQTYKSAVVVGYDADLNADGDITFESTVDSSGNTAYNLNAYAGGDVYFNDAVGGISELNNLDVYAAGSLAEGRLSGDGYIYLNGGAVSTISDQSYGGNVVLGRDTDLNAGGDISFYGTVDSSGDTTGSGEAFPYSVVSHGHGLTAASTGGNITFYSAVGGISELGYLDVTAVAINIDGLTVDTVAMTAGEGTTGDQNYNSAVVLGDDTTLTAGGAITFTGTVNSSINGSVSYAHTLTTDSAGATTFNDAVGGNYKLGALDVTVGDDSAINLNGGAIDTIATSEVSTGNQTYNGKVVLGANTILTAGGNIVFGDTVDSSVNTAADMSNGYGLTANSVGYTTFNSEVGGDYELGYLAVTADTINLDGGAIDTVATTVGAGPALSSGDQTYTGAVVLGDNAYLRAGGDITFGGTVDSSGNSATSDGYNLRTFSDYNITFNGAVGVTGRELGSLYVRTGYYDVDGVWVEGDINLNGGDITTIYGQNYNGAVMLGAAAQLSGEYVDFDSTVDGNYDLAINADTYADFDASVGSLVSLASLTVNAGDEMYFDGHHDAEAATPKTSVITTTGYQTYTGAVLLDGNDFSLESSFGNITFDGTVDGAWELEVQTGKGDVTFLGAVGADEALESLTVGSLPDTIHIDGGAVTTTGDQIYNDAVELGDDTTLTAGGNITFNGTVDSDKYISGTSGYSYRRNLTANSEGNITFKDSVGGSTVELGDLDVTADTIRLGVVTLGGDFPGITVETSGNQTYNGAVVLGDDADLTAGGDITFNGTFNSVGYDLDTYSGNDTVFNGAAVLGGVTHIISSADITFNSTVDSSGNSGDVYTESYYDTTFNGAAVFGDDTTIYANDNITFNSTADLGFGADLRAGYDVSDGDITFNDAVFVGNGEGTSLTTNDGNIIFNGTVDASDPTNSSYLYTDSYGSTMFNGEVGSKGGLYSLEAQVEDEDIGGGSIYVNAPITADYVHLYNLVDLHVTENDGNIYVNSAITSGGETILTAEGFVSGIYGLEILANNRVYVNAAVTAPEGYIIGAKVFAFDPVTVNDLSVAEELVLDGNTADVGGIQIDGYNTDLLDCGGMECVGGETGNLFVNAPVTDSRNYTGYSNVYFNGPVTYSGDSDLGLTTDSNMYLNAPIINNIGAPGNMSVSSVGNISIYAPVTNSGTLGFTATAEPDGSADISVNAPITNTGTGSLSMIAEDGGIYLYTDISSDEGAQNYYTPVVLGNNVTLTGGHGAITFNGTVGSDNYDDPYSLDIVSHGDVTFYDTVGSNEIPVSPGNEGYFGGRIQNLTVETDAKINLNGRDVYTEGDQTYTGAVVLGYDAYLEAGDDITFDGTVDSLANYGYSLATHSEGDTTFEDAVGGGADGALGDLDVTADTINLNGGVGYDNDGNVTVNTVKTSGDQTYNGTVALGYNTGLYAGGDITFNGTVDSAQERFAGEGLTEIGLTTYSAGDTTFNYVVGGTDLSYLAVSADGVIYLNAGVEYDEDWNIVANTVRTSGDQTYTGAVALGYDTDLYAGGDITFDGTVDSLASSAYSLTTYSEGDTTFKHAVGGGTGGALGYLYVEAGYYDENEDWVDGSINLNGGDIITSGGQDYYGAVVLGAAAHLSGDYVDIDATIDGNYDLTIDAVDYADFDASVGSINPLASLTVNAGEAIYFDGYNDEYSAQTSVINTTGEQTYNGDVLLYNDFSLSSSAGGITFENTVDAYDSDDLTVESYGDTTFNGAVNVTGDLEVNITGEGVINLNGVTVDTGGYDNLYSEAGYYFGGGDQTYNGAVMLGADTTLTAGGDITFAGTVDGAWALDVQADSGDVTFGGEVGTGIALASLTVNSAVDTIHINGGAVTTTGAQTYNDSVELGSALTVLKGSALTATSVDAAGYDLTLDFVSQVTVPSIFTNVDNFISKGAGGTLINGDFETDGNQTYSTAVTLDGAITLTGDTVRFGDTLDSVAGYDSLIVTGNARFDDLVGGTHELAALTVTGDTYLNGGEVTTTGAQTYTEAVTLGEHTTLTSTNAGDITLSATVDGAAYDLTVNTDGLTTFGDTVDVRSLTTDADGGTDVNAGAVITTLNQTYGDAVTTNGDTTFTSATGNLDFQGAVTLDGNTDFTTDGGAVTFADTIDAAGHTLFIDANAGNITLSGAVNAGIITLWGNTVAWNDLTGADMEILGTNLVMNGDINSSGAEGVRMIAGDTFKNAGSHDINLTGGGNYLLYSVDPARNILGGLIGSAQFSTTWANGPAPLFGGNGFLYSLILPVPTNMREQSFQANLSYVTFDVPRPGAATHGGGFFSVINTPTNTNIYRREHRSHTDPTGSQEEKEKKKKKDQASAPVTGDSVSSAEGLPGPALAALPGGLARETGNHSLIRSY